MFIMKVTTVSYFVPRGEEETNVYVGKNRDALVEIANKIKASYENNVLFDFISYEICEIREDLLSDRPIMLFDDTKED